MASPQFSLFNEAPLPGGAAGGPVPCSRPLGSRPTSRDRGILALVGEAPGRDEVIGGAPFQGRAGKLLDRMLEAAGIERSRLLICNVFRYRPPGNKIGHFFASRRRAQRESLAIEESFGSFNGAYPLAELKDEIDGLGHLLREENVTIAVALGNVPFWALAGRVGNTGVAGELFDDRLGVGIGVMAGLHPAYLLRRNQKELEEASVSHLRKAFQLSCDVRREQLAQ